MKSPLILIISPYMDSNKKKGRNEDGLIRMSNKARINLGLDQEKSVELWPNNDSSQDRITRSRVLNIFHAYKQDLSALKVSGMSEEDCLRVGFVTTRVFEYICRNKAEKSLIWLADTIEDTVIGGDPEFLLQVDEGAYQYAAEVRGLPYNGKLGSDGPWAELRPDPEIKVESFVKNIEDLLKSSPATESINKYKWLAGCYYYGDRLGQGARSWPVGGHIHIGSPAKLIYMCQQNNSSLNKITVFGCLKKILDEFVGIPLMKIDGIEKSISRRREFGKFDDVRTDHGRLEYRTPSGEWLSHPQLASIVLGSVKAVAHAFFKLVDESEYKPNLIMIPELLAIEDDHPIYGKNHVCRTMFREDFDGWRLMPIAKEMQAIRSSGRMNNIINHGNIDINKQFITALKKKFKRLSTYKAYQQYIDGLIEVISHSDEELDTRDKDLKHTWVEGEDFII